MSYSIEQLNNSVIPEYDDNKLSFEEYTKRFHKEIVKSYERYQGGWEQFKVGDPVITLRAGFGGGAGLIRHVDCFVTDSYGVFMRLIDKETNRTYAIYKKDDWWNSIKKINDDK